MRAPRFWDNPPDEPGVLATLLAPIGWIYGAATARRIARATPWRAPVPVISVGNLVAGGAGKTPAVIMLAERLAAAGVAAHVVMRGYKGRETGPHRVDLTADDAGRVGDEALLIASYAPVWVARDRGAGARAAAEAGAQAILLDDAHQNPALFKDLTLLVVDAEYGFGNGLMIPAGPLREPVETGLARADAVLAVGTAAMRKRLLGRWPELKRRPLIAAEVRPKEIGIEWVGTPVVAFAGIARPEKFFATLRGLGADLVAEHAFADHEPFTAQALTRLRGEAERAGAQLVTTEKDAVRLPKAFRGVALPLPVAMAAEDPEALDRLLARVFPRLSR